MKTIIVGFSSRKGLNPLSMLIRLATRSSISHVYLKFPLSELDETVVYQASGLAVNCENYDLFLSKEKVVQEYEFTISDEEYEAARKFWVAQLGKPYAMMELIGFMWVLLARQFGKTVKNPFSAGQHAYVCVDICADSIGYNESGSLTPEDLVRWISKQPQARLLS